MRRHLFLLIILLLTAWRGNAQTMQGYEYWFDDGYSSKTAVTSGQPYVSFEADVSGLQAGLHYLNFRAQDVDGIWGALSRYVIYLTADSRGNSDMVAYEYWMDTDYSHRTSVKGSTVTSPFTVDVSDLQPGLHYFNFRAQCSDGQWGALSRYIVYLTADSRGNSDMVAYEYWMDTDYSHRTSVKGSTVTSPFTVDVSDLQPGLHYFNFRAQCSDGHWGAMSRYIVYISDVPASSNLAAVDYWIDSNPTKIQRQQVTDNTIVISADISKLPKGMHTFYVEGIASDGSRGMLNGYEFEVEAGDVEPYAALSENNTVLTFYCDDEKAIRNGVSVDLGWADAGSTITSVVFDESFANCITLTSTAKWFSGCSSLTTITGIEYLKTDNVTDMNRMFRECSALSSLDVTHFNTSMVTNMEEMFFGCSSLTSLDVSHFVTSNVTNMGYMFYECSSLTGLDVSHFETSNVTDMNRMFRGCSAITNLDVTSFSTSQVTNMEYMFMGCSSITSLDLSHFETPNVTAMNRMFRDASALATIYVGEGWTTASVTEGAQMFAGCTNLVGGKGTHYDPDHVDFTYARIDGGPNSQTPGYFTDKNVKNWSVIGTLTGGLDTDVEMTSDDGVHFTASFPYMTIGSYEFKIRANASWAENYGLGGEPDGAYVGVDVQEKLSTVVVNFNAESHAIDFTVIPPTYSVVGGDSQGTGWLNWTDAVMTHINNGIYSATFENMAADTYMFKIRVNHEWDYQYNHEGRCDGGSDPATFTVSEEGSTVVISFNSATELPYVEVLTGPAPDPEPYAALSENNTVLTFYFDEYREQRNGMSVGPFLSYSERGWHDQRESITNVVFDASFAEYTALTSTAHWFYGCENLASITDISNLRTDNVTDMMDMFDDCSKLTTIDVSHFNTEKVTNMSVMFQSCTSLTSLDLTNFNTSNVTNTQGMFYGCSNLVNLDIRTFDMSKVNNEEKNMFVNCSSLASIIVGNAEIPAEEYANIGNPNLLVYVNESRLAPEGVQNIVVNGVAKEIVLTDNPDGKIVNNNWYCPEPFRAEKISYTRDFRQQTQIGISRGWESLALPFAVQTITHQDKGVIAPFGSDASGLHFWLRRLGHEGLISVQMIEPNTPYIISMPNSEDYASRFNLNGRVTFAAEDAYVERTEQMEDESADYMMVPAFQRMPVSEYVYALNVGEERNGRPEGSIFERNYREVRPFEAYTVHRGDRPAPLFFDLSDLEGSTTDVPDVRWMMDDGNGEWYDLQGRKLGSTLNVQRSTLKKGVYIRNGRKTVVR